ncbi:MAG: hypothetical protein JHC31_07965 [Sulfurihydrogenibium sp.]|jgi:hypothetical protein|nr:hypothetical protein [Sulfurihydrogenibium sp.]
MDTYFSLPSDFATKAAATIITIIGVMLTIRVYPVIWKYLTQFFGKKGA